MRSQTGKRMVEWGTGAVLAALVTYYGWLIATRSADPEAYIGNKRWLIAPWTYPHSEVVKSCLLIVAEAVVLWLIMCRLRTPAFWRRALVCVVLTVPASLFGSVTLMHSPPYFAFHIFWIHSVAGLSLLTFALTGAVGLYRWLGSKLRAPG